jgi:hypothetical protein
MKKTRAVIIVLLLAIAAQGFALKSTRDFALGVEVASVDLDTVGAMLTTHLPRIPLFIGLGGNFYNERSGGPELTASVDYWLLHSGKGYLNFYLGLGLCGTLAMDQSWYSAGLRLPLGFQVWPRGNESLEMFLEAAPAWVPLVDGEEDWESFQAQLALGFRFWFDK